MFRKKKEHLSSRQFYVQFLGWLPCNGIQGSEYTTPAITELKKRLKEHSNLPKLTLKINNEGIEVSPINDNSKKKTSNSRIFPILLEDIMFVALECMESDIVACIYRNRNTQRSHYLQVHVYRFDSASTASHFVQNIHFMTTTEAHLSHVRHIEDFLRAEAVRDPPVTPKSPVMTTISSGGSSSNAASDENVPTVPEDPQVQAITDELKLKFKTKTAPILLPAKDYDTVRRKQGHIDKMGTRKCRNERVVGSVQSRFQGNADDDDDDSDDDVDDDDDDDDNGSNGQGAQPSYPLYPVRKSPASPPISPESRSPRSPESVHMRNNRYQRPDSSYGSDSNSRQNVAPPMGITSPKRQPSFNAQDAVFQFDKRYAYNESRNSTISSDRSGSSHHSTPTRNSLPMMQKPKYEIPPDYDVSPQVLRYPQQHNQPVYGYYRDDLLIDNHSRAYQQRAQYPQRAYSSNMNLNQHYSQPYIDPSELYAKPTPRLRTNKNSR